MERTTSDSDTERYQYDIVSQRIVLCIKYRSSHKYVQSLDLLIIMQMYLKLSI